MKLANISFTTFALLLASAPAMSADITVQGQVITSQGKLNSEKVEFKDPTSGSKTSRDTDVKPDAITAPGAGANLEYKLTDATRLGAGLAWVNFDGGKDKDQYNDFSLALNGTYDFLKQDSFALYALGGLSYHMVDTKDIKDGDKKFTTKNADLLNYDLGFGGRYELASNVNLGLSYRFSDTLAKGSINATSAIGNPALDQKIKGVSLQQNELIASLGYSF